MWRRHWWTAYYHVEFEKGDKVSVWGARRGSWKICLLSVKLTQTSQAFILVASCLQTWISRRKYCGGQRHRHVQPFRETMQVAWRHWWAAVRLRDEKHARTFSADTSSKARGHAHANVPNRSAESHILRPHTLLRTEGPHDARVRRYPPSARIMKLRPDPYVPLDAPFMRSCRV